jgi:hypothetical protein
MYPPWSSCCTTRGRAPASARPARRAASTGSPHRCRNERPRCACPRPRLRSPRPDALLRQFRRQPDAWWQALYYLLSPQVAHFQWYCLSVVEVRALPTPRHGRRSHKRTQWRGPGVPLWSRQNFVWRVWQTVPLAERADVRGLLVSLLTTPSTLEGAAAPVPPPRLVRTKLAKVIVDVAKQDWPLHFPDFLPTIQQLAQDPATVTLPIGLVLIKTMSEEFFERPRRRPRRPQGRPAAGMHGRPRRDAGDAAAHRRVVVCVAGARRGAAQLLTVQVPSIFALLQHVLDDIFEKSVLSPVRVAPSPLHSRRRVRALTVVQCGERPTSRHAHTQLATATPMPSPHNPSLLLVSPASSLAGSPAQGFPGMARARAALTIKSRTSSSSSFRGIGLADGVQETFVRAHMDDAMQVTALLAIETVGQVRHWPPH